VVRPLTQPVSPSLALAVRTPDGTLEPVAASWPGEARTDEPAFLKYLADLSEAARAGEVHLSFPPHVPPQITEPGAWNLVGDQAFADEYPLSWNYLDERSPNYALKQLEKRLYLRQLAPWWDAVPQGGRVLDYGGGIGRFASAWLDRGQHVTLAEPNANALTLALGHLARREPAGGRFELYNLAGESLAPLPDNTFWAVSAIEVFCYLSQPEVGMAEAARVLRPGGVLMCSVESAQGANEPGATEKRVERDMWVRYFTPETLKAALEDAGLVVERVFGTHYLPDGPLHHLIDFDRLGEPAYEHAVMALEDLLASSEQWGDSGRAWVAVARKP
jgi:ubiquinone/menaquinone biosynthesis C-methylase UbiE